MVEEFVRLEIKHTGISDALRATPWSVTSPSMEEREKTW